MQGSTQPLYRFLFPKMLIEEGRTKKLINFNLIDATADQRLLEILPAKTNDFYPLSEFHKDFTNFHVNEKDFSKTLGFEDTSYRFLENEMSDIFKIHKIHSNNAGTQYFFDLLPVFKFAKERSVSETFKDIFYSYLSQNKAEVFTTEEKFSNGYKKNICYIVNDQGQFKFLGKDIEDLGPYGVYHYISETFYQLLKETNSWLNDLYNTGYLISKSNFQKGHSVTKNIKSTIDPVGIRLFYTNLDQGYQHIDQIIAPREEINLYIKNSNNPYNRNYFSERIRVFEKIFPSEEKILQYRAQENFVNNLREEKEKKIKLFEETKNKLLEELEESKIFSQTYILYDISSVLKQTFVSELEKFTNIYSQFTIFCKKWIKISKVLPSTTTTKNFPVKK